MNTIGRGVRTMVQIADLTHHDIAGLIQGGIQIEAGLARLGCEWHQEPGGHVEGRYVMTGPSGRHSLMITATDCDRLNAHWRVFASHPANA